MSSERKPPTSDAVEFSELVSETEALLAETERAVEDAVEPLFDEEAGLRQLRRQIKGRPSGAGAPRSRQIESRRSAGQSSGSGGGTLGTGRSRPMASPYGDPYVASREQALEQPLVRPYAMTGGRTRPRYQLAIEALVTTTATPDVFVGLLPEHQQIGHLCRETKSVAEVSALMTIPLGVARILLADLAEAGLVVIHETAGNAPGGVDPEVLARVLDGLRKL